MLTFHWDYPPPNIHSKKWGEWRKYKAEVENMCNKIALLPLDDLIIKVS